VLLQGYRLGVFPMAMADARSNGSRPIPADFAAEGFHVPHTVERAVRKGVFEIRIDVSFTDVMRECARRPETWINDQIIASYVRLHQLGHAHSIEAWQDGKLAGDFTVSRSAAPSSASRCFNHVRDASKVALLGLVEHLRSRKFVLLDTQWLTPHLQQFGAIEVPRPKYFISSRQR